MTPRTRFHPALVLAALGLVTGCATMPLGTPGQDASLAGRCERVYAVLDAEVDGAGTRDGQAALVEGFAWMRMTRFLASFATPALDGAAFAVWHARGIEEDRQARLFEIANLPRDPTRRVTAALADEGFAGLAPAAYLEGCGHELGRRDAADASRRHRLLASARVPDDYDALARVLGAYPLTQVGFAAGVRWYERAVLAAFARPRDAAAVVAYAPETGGALDAGAVQALLRRASDDPLGMPAVDGRDVERLLATFAPILEVEARDTNDRLGRPVPRLDAAPGFVAAPVVFGRLIHTRFAGRTRVQLVYTAWFAARPPAYPGDPLAGSLDAVIWRVTLGDNGAPLVFDSIHACGCHALFVTTPRVVARPRPDSLDEQALIPATLPRADVGDRIAVRLEGGTHYVRGVRVAEAAAPDAIRYRIEHDDALRSVRLADGSTRSLFAPDGLVAGTARSEGALFWPMGIRSAGAMRQWGRHATAFIGTRHFDEAFLFDRYFLPAP